MKLADMWIVEYYLKHRSDDDLKRRRLGDIALEVLNVLKTDPEAALALCLEGRTLAEQCGEPWWALYYENRRVHTLLQQCNYNAALNVALPAIVEARKPQYAECPQRICLYEAVIWVYLGIDAIGYTPQITEAMAYMQQQIPPDLSCYMCHGSLEIAFHYAREEFEQAEVLALRYLEATQQSIHYQTAAYLYLCAINCASGRWQHILGWAREAEVQAAKADLPADEATSLAWQAAALRREGHDEAARQVYRNAQAKAAVLTTRPTVYYYHACCAYHEQYGEYHEALALRRKQLEETRGTGQIKRECDILLAICRLHQQLELAWTTEEAALRELAQRLIDPAWALVRLADLERTP